MNDLERINLMLNPYRKKQIREQVMDYYNKEIEENNIDDSIAIQFFISGNVPSSKNNRFWTGKRFIASKAYRDYRDQAIPQFEAVKEDFLKATEKLDKPLIIDFFFIRGTHHKFDYHNVVQGPADILTSLGMIPDDNATEMIPSFSGFSYDKEHPGMWITVYK